MRRRWIPLLTLLVLGSCGKQGASSGDAGDDDGRIFLTNGIEVVVEDDGGLSLVDDGRRIWGLAPGHGPRVSTFGISWSGDTAIWEFTRTNEETVEYPLLKGVEQGGGYEPEGIPESTWAVFGQEGSDEEVRVYLGANFTDSDFSRVTIQLPTGQTPTSVALPVRCTETGTFHGFGGQYETTDQRGKSFDLFVSEQGIGREPTEPSQPINGSEHTAYFPMPYYVDADGAGAVWDTDYRMHVDLCATDPQVAWFETLEPEHELWVLSGPTPADVIRQLSDRVSRPKRPPTWAWSPWMAAQGGSDSVRAEKLALEAAQIPYSAIWVQDWTGIRMNLDGGFGVQYRWLPDLELYPDLAELIAEFHADGKKFLTYANPFVSKTPTLEHYPEMVAQGLTIKQNGEVYDHAAPNLISTHPDLTNEASREYVKSFLRAMVQTYGMDGWMVDFAEWLPLNAELSNGSDPRAYHNRYPEAWQRLTREVMDEVRPDGDWVSFARSGWRGVHDVAMIHWVGDQECTWSEYDGLPTVVPAMLNLGLSGQPYVTHDIAGFSGGPSGKELFLRWTELGAFTPIMRTHDGNKKLENWSWDSDTETTAHFRRFANIHELLVPELEAMAAQADASSMPMVRHLMIEFPNDVASRAVHDQFMLGDSLLVAPVVEEGATTRSLYLPPGTWYHVWTGDTYDGGATLTIDAPIGSPPVFSLGGDRPDLRAVP